MQFVVAVFLDNLLLEEICYNEVYSIATPLFTPSLTLVIHFLQSTQQKLAKRSSRRV